MEFRDDSLASLTRDFVVYHLTRIRGGNLSFLQQSLMETPDRSIEEQIWTPETLFTQKPIFVDSLELVTLAGFFADSFGIRITGLEDLLLAKPSLNRWTEILKTSLTNWHHTITFFSSGSQGIPRKTSHSMDYLLEEAQYVYDQLITNTQGSIQRILSYVPTNHIYGFLFSFLLPQQQSLPQVVMSGINQSWQEGDLLVTTPVLLNQWRQRGLNLPNYITILVSTAPLGQEEAHWLDLTQTPWLEIYGSSETSGIGYRNSFSNGFTLFPWWKLLDQDTDGSGISWTLSRDNLQLPLPDLVEVTHLGTILPKGRIDQAVQVGGINVYPKQTAEFIEHLPGVAQSRVRIDNPSMPRLKAFIVPEDISILSNNRELGLLEQRIREACSLNMPSVQRPSTYTFGLSIPTNAMGKEADWSET
jgi:long-chain acyl-CoA synthetase